MHAKCEHAKMRKCMQINCAQIRRFSGGNTSTKQGQQNGLYFILDLRLAPRPSVRPSYSLFSFRNSPYKLKLYLSEGWQFSFWYTFKCFGIGLTVVKHCTFVFVCWHPGHKPSVQTFVSSTILHANTVMHANTIVCTRTVREFLLFARGFSVQD